MNEAALKARLKIIAQEKLKTFNEVWKQLLLERFLARLSQSTHREQFIFKGGLLLAQYIDLGRETTDIDLSMTKMKSECNHSPQSAPAGRAVVMKPLQHKIVITLYKKIQKAASHQITFLKHPLALLHVFEL
jgi:hypothetical protein